MKDPTRDRKIEHLRIIEGDRDVDRRKHYFDAILLRHRALPELDLKDVDPSIVFLGRKLSFPLLVSCMTGGDHEWTRTVNRNLAQAAEACGVAMGVGSQRVMFTHPDSRSSFEIRRWAPTALLFANLGAVQLNYGFGLDQCRQAVETVGADGLYLHLNPLQEVVQPEGDTDFSGLAEKIGDVSNGLKVPVLVKEIGAGISEADAELLIQQGIRYLDVAGAGGTSWSRIEHHRREERGDRGIGLVFQDWGLPTPMALRRLKPYRDRVTLIASGGIRSGLDLAKAVFL
jgi:isopentenyl-diphosphate delta-isomerase